MEISLSIARKVLATVDAGLCSGKGRPIPGQMCVEAAVCYAMGLPHDDNPPCVSRAVWSLKIALNDASWSSYDARAKGMRRLALAQLGSAGVLDATAFARRVAEMAIRVQVPAALRAAATLQKDAHHKGALLDAAKRCEAEGSEAASEAARAASWAASEAVRAASWAASWAAGEAARAASAAARAASEAASWAASEAASWAARAASEAASDKALSDFAEGVVQILITMEAPGVQWLSLTE